MHLKGIIIIDPGLPSLYSKGRTNTVTLSWAVSKEGLRGANTLWTVMLKHLRREWFGSLSYDVTLGAVQRGPVVCMESSYEP